MGCDYGACFKRTRKTNASSLNWIDLINVTFTKPRRVAMFVENKLNSSALLWLFMLLLIICPSSYKARPDNLIGPNSSCSDIVFRRPSPPQAQLPDQIILRAGISLAGTRARKFGDIQNYLTAMSLLAATDIRLVG